MKMTECERIVEQGILPKSFFEEEIRCEFLVTNERKKMWAVLLDLLFVFDKVCKKNNLKYFLIYGSLLGAVRHKGFIPWDDDLDVAMPRTDYEKLLTLSKDFGFPYFMQTPYTDAGYFYSFLKIRNSNTTAISEKLSYQRFNSGIVLDVFPLDDFSDGSDGEIVFERIKHLVLENSTYMRMSNPHLTEEDKARIARWDRIPPFEVYDEIQRSARSFEGLGLSTVACPVVPVYGFKRGVFQKCDFEKNLEVDFEGYKFPIPCGYENILKTIYGNYMQMPPKEDRGKWHDGCIYNPDISYNEFLKNRMR